MSKQSTLEEPTAEQKFVLKPPVRREDLLLFTEEDPEGADEFLELLREFREDRFEQRRQSRKVGFDCGS